MVIYCPNCGKENDEDTIFCSSCGSRINVPVGVIQTNEKTDFSLIVGAIGVFTTLISMIMSIVYYFIDSKTALKNYNTVQNEINLGQFDIAGTSYMVQSGRQYLSSNLHNLYIRMAHDIDILLYSGLGLVVSLACAVLGVYFTYKKNIYGSICFGVGGFINLIIGIYLITFMDMVNDDPAFFIRDMHLTGAVALISGIILIITAVLVYINLNKQHI